MLPYQGRKASETAFLDGDLDTETTGLPAHPNPSEELNEYVSGAKKIKRHAAVREEPASYPRWMTPLGN